MPRPRTRSTPVTLRFDLETYAQVEALASRHRQTVAETAEALVIEGLTSASTTTDAIRPDPPSKRAGRTTGAESECGHPKHTVIAGGLHRCPDCGAIRGLDGEWRAK